MIVIGVTGTKGKSTTSNLIAKTLQQLGEPVGLTSTVNFIVGKNEWLNDKKMTMLGRFALQKLLRDMVASGARYAIIETSSEGIAQYRHSGIEYDVCVFTNLSPEHIESHGSFENYRAAKELLFKHLTRFPAKTIKGTTIPKIIVTNADDEESARILQYNADKKTTYGMSAGDVRMSDVNSEMRGVSFQLNQTPFQLQLIGDFNAANAAAAATTIQALGFDLQKIAEALAKVPPVPGRQEFINAGQNFLVMVDYAYDPTAQTKLYELISQFQKNRIIHVTGSAGGGRDKSRRQTLGKLAGEKADVVIVTNEDPYDEDPQVIIDAVASGARGSGKTDGVNLFKILDRGEALHKALSLAHEGDLVLITGKGAEQAICVANGKKIRWDDRRVVRDYFKK